MGSAANTPDASTTPQFQLTVSPDRLRVAFSGPWSGQDAEAMRNAVREAAKQLGLPDTVPVEALDRLQEHAEASGGEAHDFPLVEGKPPGVSTDGYIEWARDFFDNSFVVCEDTGQIDYRRRRAQLSLEEGELIARVVEATQGEDGADVFGARIRARIPHAPTIVTGKGVRHEKDTSRYFAANDGRFRWNGRRLDVDTVCTVDGDVGLGSGDIEHKGAVIVTGDVQEGAAIRAKGDIEVMGVVEAADVETAGSLMVRRGIIGRRGKRIQAGRDVFARFIIEGHVTARGSVTAEREIINSEIVSGGAVSVRAGRAFGGTIDAHGGVEVKSLGSEGLVHTKITVGEDPFLDEVVAPLEKELTATRNRAEALNGQLRPLLTRKEVLRPDQKRAMAELLRTVRALAAEVDRLRAEIRHLREESDKRARERIVVRDRLYPEVEMHMRGRVFRVREAMRGAFSFMPERGTIGFTAK